MNGMGTDIQVTGETPPYAVSLAAATAGRHVRIDGLHAGRDLNRRLAELGLRSGTLVEVMQNHGPDGVIVGLGSERLALPRDLALRIRIADPRHGGTEVPGALQ